MIGTVSLCVLLLGLQVCTARNLGHIDEVEQRHLTPGEALSHDVTISAGSTIQIECTSSASNMVTWRYPSQNRTQTSVTIAVAFHEGGGNGRPGPYYSSMLTLSNASYTDTGVYQCLCAGGKDINHILRSHMGAKVISERHVYIYVKDNEHLFQGTPSTMPGGEYLSTMTRKDMVIPCSVTNPNATVTLMRARGPSRRKVIAVDNKKCSYDPKVGFTLTHMKLAASGQYECRAEFGDSVESRQFYVRVLRSDPLLMRPVLRGATSLGVGVPTTFKCQVAAGIGQTTVITWWKKVGNSAPVKLETGGRIKVEEAFETSMCSGQRKKCSFLNHLRRNLEFKNHLQQYIRYIGKLKIADSKLSDSGTYICKAWSSEKIKSSNEINLTVRRVTVSLEGRAGSNPGPQYSATSSGHL